MPVPSRVARGPSPDTVEGDSAAAASRSRPPAKENLAMKKRIGALLAVAAGVLALLPATSAEAAHHIGGYDVGCFVRDSKSYDGIQAAVDGLGSDTPRNALVAGRARVSSAAACNVTNGIDVVRT